MRHKRTSNFILGGALIGAFFVTQVSAYNQEYTHPALTDEIVDFYNLNFFPKLGENDKKWLIKGSIDEDTPPRWMNHFYDPVHNIGVAGFPTSKQWAMSSAIQSNFAMSNPSIAEAAGVLKTKSSDDFSYQRAKDDYAEGDRQRAMIAFGHTLHLLEDAGVPDHTRNDIHLPTGSLGSPLEQEMAKWNPDNFHVASKFKKEGLRPVILSNLGEYFDRIAKYSNGNFFSKDTISDSNYLNPVADFWTYNKNKKGEENLIGYKKDNDGSYMLVKNIVKTGKLTISEKDILDGYWDRLSKEVVLNGAGALKLFIDEAERAKTEYANRPPEKPSWLAKILGLIGKERLTTSGIVSPQGVDNPNDGDSMVTPSLGVTNSLVSPMPVVTKAPVTSVTPLTPSVSPIKTPTITPKPSQLPISSPIPFPEKAEKVNINTANKELLMTLKGIKDAKSDAIIQYRETQGPFKKIEEILNVSGIGQATFSEIKDLITVGDVVQTPAPAIVSGGGGGGGGGGSSSTPTPTPSVSPTPTPTPTPTLSPTPTPSLETDGDTANSGDVVINEIAWMGTFASLSNNEWIELYNTTSQTINMTGWTLKSEDNTPDITLNGSVGPLGFYLLERTDETTLPDITADQIYTGALSNTGENLVLKDISGTVIDQADGSKNWEINGNGVQIGDNTTKETAQKIGNNWVTAPSTPKAENKLSTTTFSVVSPQAVTNLTATHGSPTITATWTAPDPGDYNIASLSYDMRYSISAFSDAASTSWWSAATVVASSSLPSVASEGSSQSATFDVAYQYNQTLYFALRTKVINITTFSVVMESEVSNVAMVSFAGAIDDGAWAMFGKDQYHTSFAANLIGPIGSSPSISEFPIGPDDPLIEFDNVFRSDALNASCNNGGDNVRLYDHNHNSLGAYPCSGQYFNTWGFNFNSSFNDTIFTEFEQVGTLPCGTYEECENATTTLSVRQVVLRDDAWTPSPTWSVGQPVADADGNTYFGATDGSSHKFIKLNKNGVKQWEYVSNASIGTPAVLSDGTVYFGRIGAGGALVFTALNSDGTKKWDYDDASSIKAVTVSPKGEPHFTYNSGSQDKLTILKPDGSVRASVNGTYLSKFYPIILEDGTAIVASYPNGGNQFFDAYSADGIQLWSLAYIGASGHAPSNPSYDLTTSKTYSAAGPRLLEIPSGGAVLNAHRIDIFGIAATTVAISSDTLYVGFNDINIASGSRLFAVDKLSLTTKWSFSADGRVNDQIVVDKNDNIYFSTESGALFSVNKNGGQNWKIESGVESTISPILTKNGIIWGYGSRIVLVK